MESNLHNVSFRTNVRNLRFLVVALLEMTERVLEITDIKKEFLRPVTA